jgi:drug/metabolite transporter (DMT)-like permease
MQPDDDGTRSSALRHIDPDADDADDAADAVNDALLPSSPAPYAKAPARAHPASAANPTAAPSQHVIGLLLAVSASIAFGFMQVAISYGTQRLALSPLAYGLARGVVSCVAAPLALLHGHTDAPPLDRRSAALVGLRGLIGASAMLCKYFCLSKLPLSDATAVLFSYPMLSLVLGWLLLGEAVGAPELLCGALCFSGILVIASASPDAAASAASTDTRLIGLAFGLSGALLTATAFTLTRFIGPRVHHQWNVLALGVSSTALSLVLLGWSAPSVVRESLANAPRVAALAGGAVCAFLGSSGSNRALQIVPAGYYSVLRNGDIPVAMVLGALFLGDTHFARESVVGAALIGGATMCLGLRRMQKA